MQTQNHAALRLLGAMLKYEVDSNYCRASADFTNSGSDPVTLQPGTLFTGGSTPAVFDTGAVAPVTGICLVRVTVNAGETVPVAWLEQGPAIVNANEIDFPSDSGQRTTIETDLKDASIKLVDGLDT